MSKRRALGPFLSLPVLAAWALHVPVAAAQSGAVRVRFVPPPSASPRLPRPAPPPAPAGAPLPRIMLTGYWPPSNEAVRRFSTDPAQNPQGWIGGDWENRGYDVFSFFPEFQPPNCSSCGKGQGDLEVDYQDTSIDFWNIVEQVQPIAIITFSRGFLDNSWEVEMNQFNKTNWIPDFQAPFTPTPNPPDASVPAGTLRPSTLPVVDIVNAVNAAQLGVNAFVCFTGGTGGFLSEFIAYHGVWYQDQKKSPADPAFCAAAGHVHVGGNLNVTQARLAAEVTLRTVIQHVDAVRAAIVCQPDIGFSGPGPAALALCGQPLATGNQADLFLGGAEPSSPAFLIAGLSQQPTPLGAGLLVPVPPALVAPVFTDADGIFSLAGLPGGTGGAVLSVYLQVAYPSPSLPGGVGLSNALRVELLP